jgi:PAS domain S-box-containing protein
MGSTPLETQPTSALLSELKLDIIQNWEKKVGENIPAAKEQSQKALRDSLPKFLDKIIRALSINPPQPLTNTELQDIAEAHGTQRTELMNYTLLQVMDEYRILREVIIETLENKSPLPIFDRDIILTSIENAMAESGAKFMKMVQQKDYLLRERYKLVINNIKDHAIIYTDRNNLITEWNRGAENITGYKREEVMNKPGTIIFNEKDKAKGEDLKEIKTALEKNSAENQRWHVKKNGDLFFANGIMNPVFDDSKNHMGYVKVFRDQTQELKRNEEIENSRKELHSFFMQAPTGMVILNGPEFKFTLANPIYEKLVGRKICGKTIAEAFLPEEVSDFIPMLENVYKTGQPYIATEVPFNVKDENGVIQHKFLNFIYHPYRDNDQKIIGIFAQVNDVTKQVQAKKIIEESERVHREIANTLHIIIWTARPDGFVDWYSDWWYEYTGYPRGTKWDDQTKQPMHSEDVERTQVLWPEALKSGKIFEMEQRFRRGSDGQYRWHLVRGVPVRNSNGQITKWIGSNTDIHDQKIAHDQIKKEQEMRERFVEALTHDLRTPLTAARMSAQLISRNANTIAQNRKHAVRIVDTIDRADKMIQDLLDASRIKAGEELTLELSNCDLALLTRDTIEELITIHGDRFSVETPENLEIKSSCAGYRRILENLCNNAIKYGSREKDITVTLKELSDEIELKIHNWGNPIPEAEQKKLFELYKRSETTKKGNQVGWGLGLTLVKGITEALGGSVSVQSNEEEGTSFIVVFKKSK